MSPTQWSSSLKHPHKLTNFKYATQALKKQTNKQKLLLESLQENNDQFWYFPCLPYVF